MTVTEDNSELAQHEGHESDGEKSEGTSSTVEIRDDDLVVQILARLDGESFEQAVQQDARVRCHHTSLVFPAHSLITSADNHFPFGSTPKDDRRELPHPTPLPLAFHGATQENDPNNAPRHRRPACHYSLPRRALRAVRGLSRCIWFRSLREWTRERQLQQH